MISIKEFSKRLQMLEELTLCANSQLKMRTEFEAFEITIFLIKLIDKELQ